MEKQLNIFPHPYVFANKTIFYYERRSKMQLQSKSLGKTFDFVTFEREENGRVVKIIMHDSLEDVIHNQAEGVNYSYDVISADRNHSIVKCEMSNKDGSRHIVAIGESVPETLDNDIAQKYPTLIASQRAFDRAAIRFLNLPGKVLSNVEMSFIDDFMVDDVVEDTPAEKTSSGGIVSSVIVDDSADSFEIGDDTTVDTGFIVDDSDSVVVVEDETDTVVEEEVVVTADPADDALPFDIEGESTEDESGNYVITMNGKYANAGLTISEIYKTDASWVEWIADNFKARNPVAEKDVAQIKKFVASKRGA